MVKLLKFRDVKDSFQCELNEGIRKIRSSPIVYVFADKANNIYEMSKAYLPSLKLAIESNTLQEHLLLWHSKTTKTTFVRIQHVV